MPTARTRGPRPRLNYRLMKELLADKSNSLTEVASQCKCSVAAVHRFENLSAAERRKILAACR